MNLNEIIKNKQNLINFSNENLIKIIFYLLKLVFALKKQLGDNTPPPTIPSSQIPPYKKNQRKKGKRKKKNGRKKGHRGSARNQNKEVTHKEVALPDGKCDCNGTLGKSLSC